MGKQIAGKVRFPRKWRRRLLEKLGEFFDQSGNYWPHALRATQAPSGYPGHEMPLQSDEPEDHREQHENAGGLDKSLVGREPLLECVER
jgi:hypothetical protein